MNEIDKLILKDAGESQKSTLELLTELGQEQVKKEQELKELQELVSKKEDEIKEIRNIKLPKAMNELGQKEVSLTTGEKLVLKKSYFGSIKDNEEQFFEYLSKYELDDIIKNTVTTILAKEEAFKAKELAENLQKMGYTVDHKKVINANTLKAFIKERMEKKEELEEEYLKQGGIPCNSEHEKWNDYLEFAKTREQEEDLLFPIDLAKVMIVEQTKVVLPKKKK